MRNLHLVCAALLLWLLPLWLLPMTAGATLFSRLETSPPALRRAGPPPQYPADGHRHPHPSGATLRFDADIGVYAVLERAETWYFGDTFLRLRAGEWEFSESPRGPWQIGPREWVPFRLRTRHYADERAPREASAEASEAPETAEPR